MVPMSILDFWPIKSPPRPNQIKALEWIENQDAKYIILEAPVGSGKSLIGLTYSRYISGRTGHSFILTPQRILQEQYEQTLDDKSIASLYGKANYPCKSKNTTCDIGSIIKPRCDSCPYERAKAHAKSKPNVVFNYKLALLLFGYTQVFDPRSLMILDECHTVEEHLTEFNAITVYEKRAEKFGIKWRPQITIKYAYKWLKDTYIPAANEYLKVQFELVEPLLDKGNSDLTQRDIKTLREYNSLEDHIDDVSEFLAIPLDSVEENFVLVHDKSMMKFKRITGAHGFKNIVEPMADKFLFMSSTILDHKGFCRDLGINIEDAAFLSLDSEFPIENRPIFYMPQMKMNAAWKNDENEKSRDVMVGRIKEILELHKDESGIIHTANFQIAKWLVDELEYSVPQQVLHHNPDSGDDRNAIINQYTTTPKPTILISPSITEGLDLVGDLGRFAIFAKVPFGFLGDQWIKKRLKMSQSWYQRRALIDVIQGGGRIVRSSTDTGNVYILDASWAYLYSQTSSMVPLWWKESYRVL
jgi:Rad3-related DNA helicase